MHAVTESLFGTVGVSWCRSLDNYESSLIFKVSRRTLCIEHVSSGTLHSQALERAEEITVLHWETVLHPSSLLSVPLLSLELKNSSYIYYTYMNSTMQFFKSSWQDENIGN